MNSSRDGHTTCFFELSSKRAAGFEKTRLDRDRQDLAIGGLVENDVEEDISRQLRRDRLEVALVVLLAHTEGYLALVDLKPEKSRGGYGSPELFLEIRGPIGHHDIDVNREAVQSIQREKSYVPGNRTPSVPTNRDPRIRTALSLALRAS